MKATGIMLALLLTPLPVHAAQISGSVDRTIDGDTFWLCDPVACHKIRLCGVDAPERGDRGSVESTNALDELVRGKEVVCVQVGGGTPCDGRSRPTNRDRIVAQCTVDGIDIAAHLVQAGLACDWIRFSGGYYSR